ncbi:hypothetical protein B0H10DRAFT_2029549 [Mycena sp. CBHHK59/15]|nr:hypothetical protein B0H10DRAFT_2029549 [Mycena sp. CBHHK59/15]
MSSHPNRRPKRKRRARSSEDGDCHPPVPEVKRPRQAVWTSMWTREEMAADVEDGLCSTAESEVDWELVLEKLRRTAGLQVLERFHNDDRFDQEPPAPSWYGFREIDGRKGEAIPHLVGQQTDGMFGHKVEVETEIIVEEPVVLQEGSPMDPELPRHRGKARRRMIQNTPSGSPLAKEMEPTSSPLRRINYTKLDLSPRHPPRRERRETNTRQSTTRICHRHG